MTRFGPASHHDKTQVRRRWIAVVVVTAAVVADLLLAGATRSWAQSSPQDELAAGASAERSAHYEDAVRHYERFLAIAGSSVSSSAVIEARTRLATAFFMLHRYHESLEALQPVMPPKSEAAPGAAKVGRPKETRRELELPAQAWLVRGLDDLESARPGDHDQLADAVDSLRRALKLNPESGTARMALGDALARGEHLEDAADEYRQQSRRTPELADAWYKLGVVYTDLARELAAAFSRDDPGNELAIQLAADRLSDTGDYRGAAQALFSVLRSAGPPVHVDAGNSTKNSAAGGTSQDRSVFNLGLHATFGAALLQLGYSRAAEGEFKAELSHDPDSPPAQLGMAEIGALGSNWGEALAIVRRLMTAYPLELARELESPPPTILSKGSNAERPVLPADLADSSAGKLWSSWLGGDGLESTPRLDPDPGSATAQCSSPLSARQREPGYWITEPCSVRLLQDLRALRDPTRNERAKFAETEYRLGDYDSARESALALLHLAKGDAWGRYWLAKSYAALAGQCFGKLAEVSPNSARVDEILARYHSEHQQLGAARSEYEAALRLEPKLPDLHLGLGTVYWQMGDWTRAQVELRKTLDLSPGSAVAAYELGDSYVQQHQWRQAADYLQRALTDPAVERKARLDLAKAQDALGNRAEAIKMLTLLAQDDRDGEIHYRLAMLYRQTGDSAKAEAALAASEALRKASDQIGIDRLEDLEKAQAK